VQFREKSFTPHSNRQFKEFLDNHSKRQQLVSSSLGYDSNVSSLSQDNMNSDPFNVYSNNLGNIPLDVSSSYIFL
jgi:hypothetical protein